ncbi:MAG: DUF421 domain-containing protein [Chloroflexota bacterium]
MLTNLIPLLAVFAQTLIIYLFLILCLSLLGRREISQLTSVELVVLMVLGSAVETSMVDGNTSLPAGLVSATTLLVCNRLLTLAFRRWAWLRRLVIGGPVILVSNGHVLARHLSSVGLTEADVLQGIRERGYPGLDEVRFAVLEVDGSIGVVPNDAPIHAHGRRIRPRPLPVRQT